MLVSKQNNNILLSISFTNIAKMANGFKLLQTLNLMLLIAILKYQIYSFHSSSKLKLYVQNVTQSLSENIFQVKEKGCPHTNYLSFIWVTEMNYVISELYFPRIK